jgi:hypothetical protein
MRKLLKISLLLTVLVVLGAGVAKADSLTYQGVTFNVSVSGNTVTMVVSGSGCTFVANCANNISLGNVTIHAFNKFDAPMTGSVTQGGVLNTNYKTPSLGNIGTGCGISTGSWICFSATSFSKLANGTFVFTATVTNGQAIDLANGEYSIQADFYDSSGKRIARMSESTAPTTVPEPASLSFLAIGLGGLAFKRFRRK